jgi:hypothetical protein
LEKDSDEPA